MLLSLIDLVICLDLGYSSTPELEPVAFVVAPVPFYIVLICVSPC